MKSPVHATRARNVAQTLLPLLLSVWAGAAFPAGPKLYETGPSEDAAYIRFVNATDKPFEVVASGSAKSGGGRLRVDTVSPASAFMPVRPKSAMAGRIVQGTSNVDIAPLAGPGELVTVVVWAGTGAAPTATTMAELPKDFNALKSTLAFYNFDPACPAAGLVAAGRDTAIFGNTAPRAVQRRAVNPVALSVQPMCGTEKVGSPLDLRTLEAGQRYSIFLAASPQGRRAFWVKDEL